MDDGLGCGPASVWSPAQPLPPAVPWAWPRVPEPASSTAGEAESGLGPRHRRAAVSRRGTHRCPRPLRAAPPAADGERGRGRLAAAQVQAQGPRPPRGPGPQRCGSRCAPGQQVRHGKRGGGCPGGLPGRAEGGGCSQLTHLWVRSARERAIHDMQTGSPARWGPPAAPHDHGAPGLWPPAFLRVPPPPPRQCGQLQHWPERWPPSGPGCPPARQCLGTWPHGPHIQNDQASLSASRQGGVPGAPAAQPTGKSQPSPFPESNQVQAPAALSLKY